eukprot:2784-Heterococcus_DN1.PRE.1
MSLGTAQSPFPFLSGGSGHDSSGAAAWMTPSGGSAAASPYRGHAMAREVRHSVLCCLALTYAMPLRNTTRNPTLQQPSMEYSDMSSATPSPCRSPQCTHTTSSCSSYQPQHNYGQQQQQQQQRKPVLVDRGTSASNIYSAQLPPTAAGAASSSSSRKKGEGAYTDFDADFDRSHRSPHQVVFACSTGHSLCFLPQPAKCLKHCDHSLRKSDVVVVQTATHSSVLACTSQQPRHVQQRQSRWLYHIIDNTCCRYCVTRVASRLVAAM